MVLLTTLTYIRRFEGGGGNLTKNFFGRIFEAASSFFKVKRRTAKENELGYGA